MSNNSTTERRFTLRLDVDLHDWLVELAKRERRTLTGQVSYILDQARQKEQENGRNESDK